MNLGVSSYGIRAGGSGGSSPTTPPERFTATAGQTVFTVTTFTLNASPLVFSGTDLCDPSEYTVSGNDVTFHIGRVVGTVVTISNS